MLDAKAARLAAFDLLARKSWSGRELGQRLRRRGAPAEVARDVVAELTARGYVDDQAFARWWAEARARGRQIGSARLRQELLAKGIPRELATAAVTAAFEETPESERAMEAGRRRLRALLTGRRDRVAARLGDYLLRRGYPPAVARSTVRRLLAEHVGEVPPEAGDDGSGV
ncbi:MAG TPA: regulatory protein RecX [Methylomirabilota bacterium]|nr:regulatory protein RecX [Methylomirabilota bacterium]